MTQTNPYGSVKSLGPAIGRFAVNTLASMVLSVPAAILVAVLLVACINKVLPFSLNADIPALCLSFPVGFVLGFRLNRAYPAREACWVWISGVVWLAYGIWGSVRHYHPRWSHGCSVTENVLNAFLVMNSRKCEGDESALAAVLFTIPAFASIAYSVGALIAGSRAKNFVTSARST